MLRMLLCDRVGSIANWVSGLLYVNHRSRCKIVVHVGYIRAKYRGQSQLREGLVGRSDQFMRRERRGLGPPHPHGVVHGVPWLSNE